MRRKRGDNTVEFYGLLGSIVLHIVFLLTLISNKPKVPELPDMIEVTIEPPSNLLPKKSAQEKQIVSQSEAAKVAPPVETERLSDEDQFAAEEKIRRGDGGGIPSQQPSVGQQPRPASKESEPQRQKPKQQKQPQKREEKEEVKKKPSQNQADEKSPKKPDKLPQNLTNLRLDTSTLEEKFGVTSENKRKVEAAEKAAASVSQPTAPPSISQYKAFSRPPGSGAAFLGSGGLSDYLPNLPDGDITLLNAKASQYAGFVRRVAVQVFAQLRTRGWENLSASEVRRIGDFTTVEAILSKEGKLLEVRLVGSSGSVPFDTVLEDATKAGAKDPNPPPGALASDGRIHFIFKARSWSSTSANPRNGALRESRWLLLATGLE